jgi:putative peptide zinc metalloprotease protein
MHDTLLSPYWYRIAKLHPRLRPHVSVRMQRTRGQAWYVLHNQATGRYHRVNAHAFELVGRLDGQTTVDDIWQGLLQRQGDEAPTQNDVIRIMGQLTDAGLVQAEVTPDVRQMVSASEERSRKERRARLNPLSFRLGLFNPSSLLEVVYPKVRRLLTVPVLLIWALLIGVSLVGAATNWTDIRNYSSMHFMTPAFLAMTWLIYPMMKAVHELGHALMLRRFGCEVPEVGVNFFMFVPMPYVDASASNRLVRRSERALISAAGIMVELALAALGLALWLTVEDGIVRQVAFVMMSIGGLSTLLFNGNPLMKFDGYFVTCDLLDLPNLANRSGRLHDRLWVRLVGWVLRMPREEAEQSESDAVERWSLRLYAPLSWLYRLGVSGLMVSWASEKSSWLGMGILVWMIWSLVLMPCKNWGNNLLNAPGFESARTRASMGGTLAVVGVLGLLTFLPLPSFIVADGVVWLPPDAQVRAGTDGEVDAVLVQSGHRVHAGQALIRLSDPGLMTRREIVLAQIEGSQAELNAAFGTDPLKVSNARQALDRDYAQLAQIDQDLSRLVLRASRTGEFVLSRQEDLDQRQVSRGQLLAYVLADVPGVVRVLVSQRDVGDVRERLTGVSVMLAERPGHVLEARTLGDTPAAIDRLPAPGLSNTVGGPVATDASDPDALKPAEPMFVMDVALKDTMPRAGGLAQVRLDLKPRPLMQTWAMRMRQLFLKHFSDVGASA